MIFTASGRIELERNVPSGYCVYNLIALTQDADLAAAAASAVAVSSAASTEVPSAEVWGFVTDDGRSIRKAVDWLLPYATGAVDWPYPQPEAPDWRVRECVPPASLSTVY